MRGVAVKTPERVALAQDLRRDGYSLREIAAKLGVKIKTVSSWLNDEDGSRQAIRRAASAKRCAGTCVVCGAITDGSHGRKNAPKYCLKHAYEARTIWTRERLILEIQRWERLYGRPPGVMDWNPNQARRLGHEDQAARFEAGGWPWSTLVVRVFGSWNAGIEAAGFTPRSPGRPRATA